MATTMDEFTSDERIHGQPRGFWGAVEGVFDYVTKNARTIVRQKELFVGTALTIIGLMSFESDKFCDGNTADYLSCTRPSTYYYFDALDIALVVLGVTLLLLWIARSRKSE
jgi:hypothetical protein